MSESSRTSNFQQASHTSKNVSAYKVKEDSGNTSTRNTSTVSFTGPNYVDYQLSGMRSLWRKEEIRRLEQFILPFFTDKKRVHETGLQNIFLNIHEADLKHKRNFMITGSTLTNEEDTIIYDYYTEQNEIIKLTVRSVCKQYLDIYKLVQ